MYFLLKMALSPYFDLYSDNGPRGSAAMPGALSPVENDPLSFLLTCDVVCKEPRVRSATPLKFNSSPLNSWVLEDKPFLLGFGNFSGANC